MSLITTNNGRIVLKKAESMMAVPYVYDSTIGDYVLGSDVYDISAVIGDSITLEQSDGNTEAKYNEFKASPLIESVSGSKYNFTAQCLDLQDKVLKSLFGAMTASGGAVALQEDFTTLYALIRIRFHDNDLPDVFLPKVSLNSKVFVNQLKTRASQGNISGTALPVVSAVENNTLSSLLYFSSLQNGTYTPYTPVLLIPKARRVLFYHSHYNDTLDYYSNVNFILGQTTHDTLVNPATGALPIPGNDSGEGGEGGGGDA